MNRKVIITAFLCFLMLNSIWAQPDYRRIKKERFGRIEYYHFDIGVDAAANYNYSFSPKIAVGIGSSRNLLNADFGLKYNIRNPYFGGRDEYISTQEILLCASLRLNVIRGKSFSLFVGGEIASHWAINSAYHSRLSDTRTSDANLADDYFSVGAKIGFKIKRWRASLYYEYNLAPAINQKYLFETKEYNYYGLYKSAFERGRIGVGLTYEIPFKI